MRKCEVDGCNEKHYGRGFCTMHYRRFKVTGDPLKTKTSPNKACVNFIKDAIDFVGDGCLEWPYYIGTSGYAQSTIQGKSYSVHRIVCKTVYGEPSKEKPDVAHSCGNRKCVNPKHLRWASKKENMADKTLHGTEQRGSANPRSKITEQIAEEIFKSEDTVSFLAEKYKISKKIIWDVRSGKTWTHVNTDK